MYVYKSILINHYITSSEIFNKNVLVVNLQGVYVNV